MASLSATLALCDLNYDALEATSKLCAASTSPRYIDDVDVSSVQEVKKFVETTRKLQYSTLFHQSLSPPFLPSYQNYFFPPHLASLEITSQYYLPQVRTN
jgi:hypothetical protein